MSFQSRRTSKVRHVFPNPNKKENTYENLEITSNPWESNMSSVNGKFLAVCLASQGGGIFTVIPLAKTGRCDSHKITGHKSNVLDLSWNPFNDNQIASASEDCTINLWNIPDEGLTNSMSTPACTLKAHMYKVGVITWHPTAENIIASACKDKIIVWNTETGENRIEIDVSSLNNGAQAEAVCSMNWNQDGTLLVVAIKGNRNTKHNLFVIDPRTSEVKSRGLAHSVTKVVKADFCDKYVFTTGFSTGEKQYALWNPMNLNTCLTCEALDSGSGVVFFFFDEATKTLFTISKGGSQVGLYEIFDEPPYVQFHSSLAINAKKPSTNRGTCFMPRRHLSFMDCEIFRFYRLVAPAHMVEPVPMILPRKSDLFQADLYPPCLAGKPSLSADEWFGGATEPPMLVEITADGLGSTLKGSLCSYTAGGSFSSSGSFSKQLSASSSSSDTRKDVTLTSSGEFDDSKYKKEIQSLSSTIDNLRRENDHLRSTLQKKEAIISDIKKLVN